MNCPVRQKNGLKAIAADSDRMERFWRYFSDDPQRLFEAGTEVFSGRWGDVTDLVFVELDGQRYLLKRFNYLGLRYAVKNLFRESRCFKAFRWGQRLSRAGIATPQPLFACEVRRVRVLLSSYILFPYIEGARNLLDLWPELDDEQRFSIMERAGSLIGRMHSQGIHHDDLNWRNLLVAPASPGYELLLVDLDGCYAKPPSSSSLEYDLRHFVRDFDRTETGPQPREIFQASWRRATAQLSE